MLWLGHRLQIGEVSSFLQRGVRAATASGRGTVGDEVRMPETDERRGVKEGGVDSLLHGLEEQ